MKDLDELRQLLEIVKTLRGPGGCPWDQQQTLSDIGRYLIEEASEVADAVTDADGEPADHVCEELGDLLMNIFLASCIAQEANAFSIGDVSRKIREKLVRRHPHVFGDAKVSGVGDVLDRWEKIKAEEKTRENLPAQAGGDGEPSRSRLDDVPRSMPPLARAYKISSSAARCGFDWPDAHGSWDKLEEEVDEVRRLLVDAGGDSRSQIAPETKASLVDELGDVLFAAVNLCRKLGFHPDEALRSTIKKFSERFQYMERRLPNLEEASLDEMDAIWNEMRHGTAASDRGEPQVPEPTEGQ